MRHRHSVTEDPIKVVSIAALAAIIGAAFALLFAPRSGSQVRGGLKRRASNMKENLHDRLERSLDEAEEAADDAKVRLQQTAQKGVRDTQTTASKVKADAKATTRRAKSVAETAKKPRRRNTNPQ